MITHNNTERLNCGERLAREIKALFDERRAWVSVSPFKVGAHEEWPDHIDDLPWKFRVLAFEVDRSFDYDKFDLHAEYIHLRHDATVDDVNSVEEELEQFGLVLDQLGYPDECSYPL